MNSTCYVSVPEDDFTLHLGPKTPTSSAMFGEDDEEEDVKIPTAKEEAEEVAAIKLKGAKYPGMGLFDAADLDMRKLRNQRKSQSVIERMRRDSEAVKRIEFVFKANMEPERTRDVYDDPSVYSGSPVSGNSHHTSSSMLIRQSPVKVYKNKGNKKMASAKRTSRLKDLLDDESAELTRRTSYRRAARDRAYGSGMDVFQDTGASSPYCESDGSPSFASHGDKDDADYVD